MIARSGVKRGRYIDGHIIRAEAPCPPPYRQVFGPARHTACLVWQATHCDPLPEWRGADKRVVYLKPPQEEATETLE